MAALISSLIQFLKNNKMASILILEKTIGLVIQNLYERPTVYQFINNIQHRIFNITH